MNRYLRPFFLCFSVFLLASQGLSAQTLTVVNETTLKSIPNVYIYNEGRNKVASTDLDGKADLTKFAEGDTLHFQHPSYQGLQLLFKEVEERNFRIALTERPVIMDEIFVSANKREQKITDIPQKVTRISEDQVIFHNPQTSADLLQSSGKVFVQKSQMGGGSPMLRGFAANSVLLSVDGVRMNNAIFRSGNLQNVISVDPNAVEGTEVLFGPGSIIYGSDALGGVMNFQTKNPELSYSAAEKLFELNSMGRYSTANNERTFHADAAVGFEKWGLLSSVTYSYFGDLRSGGNFYEDYPEFGKRREYIVRRNGKDMIVPNDDVRIQRFSGYEQLNLMQKVRYNPSGRWHLNYGFHFATTGNIPRYDRLIQRENGDSGDLVNAEWYYGPQIWMMNTLNIDYTGQTKWYDKVSAVFSRQWFQESRNDRKFENTKLRNREENVDVYTANIDFDKQWNEDKELFYGVESVYNFVESEAVETDIVSGEQAPVATRYPDEGSTYIQLAAYTKYQQDLSASLTAEAGARYSHILLESRFSDNYYDFPFSTIDINTGALSGNLGLIYRPLDDLQFNLNASTGFRAPNVDDASKIFDSEPGTVIMPNADLGPEYSYNLDFTVIKDFDERARLEINTYYTWLEDAMVRRPFEFNGQDSIRYDGQMSKVEAVVNSGQAYVYGASVGLSTEISTHIALQSELTYTRGRDRINDEPLRHVAPLFGRIGITYKGDRIRTEIYSEFNGQKPISDFSPSERSKPHLYTEDGSPAWATLNAKASYHLNEDIMLNAGVENIFDKHYRPYSSGISAPGRNVSVALRAHL
ncbi:TonB-dependent receptor [Aliifodinibius salicampi]|uniref:TonB-dependent receptor n=1 Tax=Fodinibius salicampi TaxID=1920655 RepID=A0ABT3PYU9_9BACT|nr:TonB-dependent receptor [Fodinibius salicampi]MCW9713024.1 TonB-dependent receptor [Fodinibius salicampi]